MNRVLFVFIMLVSGLSFAQNMDLPQCGNSIGDIEGSACYYMDGEYRVEVVSTCGGSACNYFLNVYQGKKHFFFFTNTNPYVKVITPTCVLLQNTNDFAPFGDLPMASSVALPMVMCMTMTAAGDGLIDATADYLEVILARAQIPDHAKGNELQMYQRRNSVIFEVARQYDNKHLLGLTPNLKLEKVIHRVILNRVSFHTPPTGFH